MIRRTYRSCVPRAQRDHGIKNVLKTGFKLAKKLATSNIERQLEKVLSKTLHEHIKLVLVE